jgi:hypothetical protein
MRIPNLARGGLHASCETKNGGTFTLWSGISWEPLRLPHDKESSREADHPRRVLAVSLDWHGHQRRGQLFTTENKVLRLRLGPLSLTYASDGKLYSLARAASATCIEPIAFGKTAYALFTNPPQYIEQLQNGDMLQITAPVCREKRSLPCAQLPLPLVVISSQSFQALRYEVVPIGWTGIGVC